MNINTLQRSLKLGVPGCLLPASKLISPSLFFYLSLIGNCLVLLGYTIGKIYSDESPCFIANWFIFFGHFTALTSDLSTLAADLLHIQHFRRRFNVNRFFAVANLLSLIGEYQELRKTLRSS